MAPPPAKSRLWLRVAWNSGLVIAATLLLGWASQRELISGNSVAVPDITATVTRGNLPITITERGEIEGLVKAATRCLLEGDQNKIVTIVPDASSVKKGEVVITFDPDPIRKACELQESKWKQAEGKLIAARGEAEAARSKSLSDIAKAELTAKLAEFDRNKYLEGDYQVEDAKKRGLISLEEDELQEAKSKLARLRTLVKKGFSPPEILRLKELEIENKSFTLATNKADLTLLEKYTRKKQEMELTGKADEAKRELSRAKASGSAAVEKAQSDLEAAMVTARLEKTALERARQQLDRTVIKATEDGNLVYSRDGWRNPHDSFQPGAVVRHEQPLFTLQDLARMQVKVRIPEALVNKIQIGLNAEIRVESLGNTVLHGRVTKLEAMAESRESGDERGGKEYVTILKLDDLPPQAGLKPGMTAEVKILVRERANVLMVPVQAIAPEGKEYFVHLVSPGGVEPRKVMIGANNDMLVEIKSGLEEGEKIALNATVPGFHRD
jgi:RND family efflux transporter MFP subunit